MNKEEVSKEDYDVFSAFFKELIEFFPDMWTYQLSEERGRDGGNVWIIVTLLYRRCSFGYSDKDSFCMNYVYAEGYGLCYDDHHQEKFIMADPRFNAKDVFECMSDWLRHKIPIDEEIKEKHAQKRIQRFRQRR